jgi:hypothetical protein
MLVLFSCDQNENVSSSFDRIPQIRIIIIIIIIIIKLQLGWHPVAVVQYTFTHKQYTEYRGRNTQNN